MNYYKALQRESNKRWDFTCTNSGKTWPTGYCAGWREWTEEDFVRMPELRREVAKLEPLKGKYHCNGHATREEAIACYRQYKLDTTVNLEGQSHSAQKCLSVVNGLIILPQLIIWKISSFVIFIELEKKSKVVTKVHLRSLVHTELFRNFYPDTFGAFFGACKDYCCMHFDRLNRLMSVEI